MLITSEIAGLIVGEFGLYDKDRDIIVEYKTRKLKRISVLHPSFIFIIISFYSHMIKMIIRYILNIFMWIIHVAK